MLDIFLSHMLKTVVEIPTIIEFSKDHPSRSKYGSNMNNNVEGKTNHNMLSAKSATCAVSLVSSYSQVNDNTLTKGIEANNAPKTAVFFCNFTHNYHYSPAKQSPCH